MQVLNTLKHWHRDHLSLYHSVHLSVAKHFFGQLLSPARYPVWKNAQGWFKFLIWPCCCLICCCFGVLTDLEVWNHTWYSLSLFHDWQILHWQIFTLELALGLMLLNTLDQIIYLCYLQLRIMNLLRNRSLLVACSALRPSNSLLLSAVIFTGTLRAMLLRRWRISPSENCPVSCRLVICGLAVDL